MKVICQKEKLAEGINVVQKAVSSKSNIQILEGILIEAGDNFKMTGNDLELAVECFVDAHIERPGAIVINSRMFGEIVRRLPDSDVLIELKDNNTVTIECENSKFNLKGILPEGFPAIPEIEKKNSFKIDQMLLRDMIRQTLFAVCLDENRPILMGSLMEYDGTTLNIVSIDGYRLALRRTTECVGEKPFSVVVPGKALNELVKILEAEPLEVNVVASDNHILFDMGTRKVQSRLLEGKFLNYAGIIPNEFETRLSVRTKELLSAIERAALMITSEDRGHAIKFNVNEERLVITSSTAIGDAHEEVPVEMDGKKLELGFNPRYLTDVLKVVEDEFIEMSFTTNVGPSVIRPVEGRDYDYMVMPVRI